MNLLLISRCEEKLQATAAGIQRQHGVQCKYYRMDLAESAAFTTDEKIWSDLRELIDSLDVGVLVNCAGICYSFPERFEDLDDLTLHSIPAVNISSLAKMTYVVLPGMSKRKRGVIINVSSVAATRTSDGAPLTALYSQPCLHGCNRRFMIIPRGLAADEVVPIWQTTHRCCCIKCPFCSAAVL